MQLPVQITSRGMRTTAALRDEVRARAAKLERFHPRITSCRVVLELAARHKRRGRKLVVRVDLKVPRGEIAVSCGHEEDLQAALRDAFDAARRKLEEFARAPRG